MFKRNKYLTVYSFHADKTLCFAHKIARLVRIRIRIRSPASTRSFALRLTTDLLSDIKHPIIIHYCQMANINGNKYTHAYLNNTTTNTLF